MGSVPATGVLRKIIALMRRKGAVKKRGGGRKERNEIFDRSQREAVRVKEGCKQQKCTTHTHKARTRP